MSDPHIAAEAFALTSDPSAYVPSPERERALEQMTSALAQGGVPCLEGPTGIGKTLLLQLLAQRLADRFDPLYVPYPMLSTPELCTLVIGLLGHSLTPDPEATLLRSATERAARGRPLVLLIDDATSLPGDTARGLAAMRMQARGALRIAIAGIPNDALIEAAAPFGNTLVRVTLEERMPRAEVRDYVAAQLEHASAPASLRRAFDDQVLEELERAASGNPRRIHLAAQSIVQRAGGSPETAEPPLPDPVAVPPPPAPAAAKVESPVPVAAPTPVPPAVSPPKPVPPAAPATPPPRVAPSPPAEPIGEYRVVRRPTGPEPPPPEKPAPREEPPAREMRPDPPPPTPAPVAKPSPPPPAPAPVAKPSPPPPAPAPVAKPSPPPPAPATVAKPSPPPPAPAPVAKPSPPPPAPAPVAKPSPPPASPRPDVQAPLASISVPAPEAPLPRPPWEEPAAPAAAKRSRAREEPLTPPAEREPRRMSMVPVFLAVAIVSAVLGFMLASRLQRPAAELTPASPPTAERTPAPSVAATPPQPPAPRAEERVAETPQPAVAPKQPPAPAKPEPARVAAPTAPAPTPSPAPDPTPARAAAPAPPPPTQVMVEISINAAPWALIEIDGREVGETPLGGVEVARGPHRFVARFPDGRVVERTIDIDASRRTLVFE